jgi:hypothetical protein
VTIDGKKAIDQKYLEISKYEWHWIKGGKQGTREWRLK